MLFPQKTQRAVLEHDEGESYLWRRKIRAFERIVELEKVPGEDDGRSEDECEDENNNDPRPRLPSLSDCLLDGIIDERRFLQRCKMRRILKRQRNNTRSQAEAVTIVRGNIVIFN